MNSPLAGYFMALIIIVVCGVWVLWQSNKLDKRNQ
jgi:hypothetical protein